MKRILSLILALAMCLGLCAALTACSTKNDSSKYVGVWKYADRDEYMYIYEDGTGDFYGSWMSDGHYNSFTWEVEGDYLVRHYTKSSGGAAIAKYTLEDDCLLDSQKKIAFRKHSTDTTVDVK